MQTSNKTVTLTKGDLVKMKRGYSGVGVVLECFDRHPRFDATSLSKIAHKLNTPYASIFWSDIQVTQLIPVIDVWMIK